MSYGRLTSVFLRYARVPDRTFTGRGGGIRTPDPLLPKQLRYQAALHPDRFHSRAMLRSKRARVNACAVDKAGTQKDNALPQIRDGKPATRYNENHAPVAQLDRVSGYEPEGREFESLRARHATIKSHPSVAFSLSSPSRRGSNDRVRQNCLEQF